MTEEELNTTTGEKYRTESVEDVVTILRKASDYTAKTSRRSDVVSDELAEAADFLEEEMLEVGA